MHIVDAHLDLAYNALNGRDVLRPAAQQPPTPGDSAIPSVGLPDLRAAPVSLICATIFAQPTTATHPGYATPDEAQAAGWAQMQWYLQQFTAGQIDLVTAPDDLPSAAAHAIPTILLLEGADPLRTPADLELWAKLGLRIVGLAWRQTRYAGGTGAPGPLTPIGRELVAEIDRLGLIHDTSHLAEAAFYELLDLATGPIIASHSNCRSIVPTDRQLSDDMLARLIARGGVIGINLFDKFLVPPSHYKTRRATLADVVAHVDHICQIAGHARAVGVGTDMDGGLGRDDIPAEITTSADLPRLADALSAAGHTDTVVAGIMGQNWLDFFRRHLPQ